MANSVVNELDWLLDDLVSQVAGAERAVVLSADGLLIGRSSNLSEEDGEHLSAVASAFQSLARSTGRHFGGGQVRQTVVEMDHAFLFVTAAGRGACLALLTAEDIDMGMVAYAMNMMVKRVGAVLSAAPRVEPHHAMTDNDRDGFGDIGGDDEETWFEEGQRGSGALVRGDGRPDPIGQLRPRHDDAGRGTVFSRGGHAPSRRVCEDRASVPAADVRRGGRRSHRSPPAAGEGSAQ